MGGIPSLERPISLLFKFRGRNRTDLFGIRGNPHGASSDVFSAHRENNTVCDIPPSEVGGGCGVLYFPNGILNELADSKNRVIPKNFFVPRRAPTSRNRKRSIDRIYSP